MIVDLSSAPESRTVTCDVAIVGSGPAGGTIASELQDAGLQVCVIESGRLRRSRFADGLREVEWRGLPIKEYSRERVLGGASSTWAGLSAPLDSVDLESRDCIGGAGWPLERDELRRYWDLAAERFGFPTSRDFGSDGLGAIRDEGRPTPAMAGIAEKVFMARAEPQRFGKMLRGLYEGPKVDLYLDGTVVGFETSDGRSRVEALRLKDSSGRAHRIQARATVLACGGIENARLLLSNEDGDGALGNGHDQVGRCLMNHPKNYRGLVQLKDPVTSWPYLFGCLHRGFAGYAGLRLTEDRQRELGVLNSYVRFEPIFPWSDDTGVESAVLLAKRSAFALKAVAKRSRKEVVELRDYSETGDDSDLQNARKGFAEWMGVGWNVVANSPSVARYAFHRLSRVAPRIRVVRLRNFMEMEPAQTNRVTLSERRDALGQRLPLVEHRTTELDRRSLIELHRSLAPALENAGIGRLDSDLEQLAGGDGSNWPITQDASHHLGTTRMGNDPRSSVCDAEGRVHGVPNLSCAGGSLFPTSGCANPTFTIVALSIRMAERLRRELCAPTEVQRP